MLSGPITRPRPLPRQMWERDIDADLNYLELLPCEGSEAFVDDLENAPSFGAADE